MFSALVRAKRDLHHSVYASGQMTALVMLARMLLAVFDPHKRSALCFQNQHILLVGPS